MAKKAKARWGYQRPDLAGEQWKPPLTVEMVGKIAEVHGIGDADTLRNDLNSVASRNWFAGLLDKREVSVPEQGAALKILLQEARSLLAHLNEVDASTKSRIEADYPNARFEHEPDARAMRSELFERDKQAVERLLLALEVADGSLPSAKGRPPTLGLLYHLCGDLIEVYEKRTDRTFSHDFRSRIAPQDDRLGHFLTDGGCFVARVVWLLFEDITPASINTAINGVRKNAN